MSPSPVSPRMGGVPVFIPLRRITELRQNDWTSAAVGRSRRVPRELDARWFELRARRKRLRRSVYPGTMPGYVVFSITLPHRVLIQCTWGAISQSHPASNEQNRVECVDGPLMVSGPLSEGLLNLSTARSFLSTPLFHIPLLPTPIPSPDPVPVPYPPQLPRVSISNHIPLHFKHVFPHYQHLRPLHRSARRPHDAARSLLDYPRGRLRSLPGMSIPFIRSFMWTHNDHAV